MSEKPELKKSKEELVNLIDDFHFHILTVLLCMDSLDALREIGQQAVDEKNASKFFYISQTSLIFRYEIELAKLVNGDEEMNVYYICNLCCNNYAQFDMNIQQAKDLCKEVKQVLKDNGDLNKNLIERRNKALAHSDMDYYFYQKSYVEDFPLDYDQMKEEAQKSFEFARNLRAKIRQDIFLLYKYPGNTDDVKHLFGMKTNDEIESESERERLRKSWHNG